MDKEKQEIEELKEELRLEIIRKIMQSDGCVDKDKCVSSKNGI